MAWRIELSVSAEKSLGRLGSEPALRATRFIAERLAGHDIPRRLGKPLVGSHRGELWRYRIGNYRIVMKIEDKVLRILVVQIGHRREVYRD